MKSLLFSIILTVFAVLVFAQQKKQVIYVVSTNIVSYFYCRPNISIEQLNIENKIGMEIGGSYLSKYNFGNFIMTSFEFPPTWTNGGNYGFSKTNPNFRNGHNGFRLWTSLKKYNSTLNRYNSLNISYTYKQLLNEKYGHIEMQGPGSGQNYYWFQGSHYSHSILFAIQRGFLPPLWKNKTWRREFGIGTGLRFFKDRMNVTNWGTRWGGQWNFPFTDDMKPKHTDDFFVRLQLHLYFKLGKIKSNIPLK